MLLYMQVVQLVVAFAACLHAMATRPFALLICLPLLLAAGALHRKKPGPRALVLMGDEWYLVYEEQVSKARLEQHFHCTEHLQILQFRHQDEVRDVLRTEQVLVLPDSADSSARRRLRSLLRWYSFPASALAD